MKGLKSKLGKAVDAAEGIGIGIGHGLAHVRWAFCICITYDDDAEIYFDLIDMRMLTGTSFVETRKITRKIFRSHPN